MTQTTEDNLSNIANNPNSMSSRKVIINTLKSNSKIVDKENIHKIALKDSSILLQQQKGIKNNIVLLSVAIFLFF